MKKVLMLLMVIGVVCAVGSAEAKKKATKQVLRPFSSMDKDQDGKISQAEFVVAKADKGIAIQTALFKKYDTNKDGFLSSTEYPPKTKGKGKKK